jgi:hypothetical protein
MPISQLGKWVYGEIQKRNMTYTGFARWIGVNPSTIGRLITDDPDQKQHEPSLELLEKLSVKTQTDMMIVVLLAKPHLSRLSATSLLIAQRIEQLPPDKRELVDSLLLGWGFKSGDQ